MLLSSKLSALAQTTPTQTILSTTASEERPVKRDLFIERLSPLMICRSLTGAVEGIGALIDPASEEAGAIIRLKLYSWLF